LTRHLQGKCDTAIPAFREALRLDPKRWPSHLFLGICLYRTNLFPAALQELETATGLAPASNPGRDDLDYWLGACRIALKQPLAGLASLERLLARNPGHVEALQLAAQTYSETASQLWNRVAEERFESGPGLEIHGHAMEAEGNIAAALDTYRQSSAVDPKRPGPHAALGRLLLFQGKPADAIASLTRSNQPESAYFTGLALIQLGRNAEAAPYLETAVQWAGHDAEPAIALAQVYLALGQKDKAAEAARRALALAPASRVARELLDSAVLR